jgi:hypothetical protein
MTEEFRIPVDATTGNQPWGIEFHITTLTENNSSWFEIKVINIDTGKSEIFGYGDSYGIEKDQGFPMYNPGPYKIEMTGNFVSVNLKIGNRYP